MGALEFILEMFWPGITKDPSPGYMNKGGVNQTYQITQRPPDPPPMAAAASSPSLLTRDVLKGGMPHADVDRFLPILQETTKEFHIDTPLRLAAFLAQGAHESNQLRSLHELWGPTEYQKRYEPPGKKSVELGNDEPGDGFKYRGRGMFQLTGKGNYRLAGEALAVDLVGDPDWAATPEGAVRVSGWFWNMKHLSPLADSQNFKEITRRINGGYLGLNERTKYYNTFLSLLGQQAVG